MDDAQIANVDADQACRVRAHLHHSLCCTTQRLPGVVVHGQAESTCIPAAVQLCGSAFAHLFSLFFSAFWKMRSSTWGQSNVRGRH